jgi:hypothetical protein
MSPGLPAADAVAGVLLIMPLMLTDMEGGAPQDTETEGAGAKDTVLGRVGAGPNWYEAGPTEGAGPNENDAGVTSGAGPKANEAGEILGEGPNENDEGSMVGAGPNAKLLGIVGAGPNEIWEGIWPSVLRELIDVMIFFAENTWLSFLGV